MLPFDPTELLRRRLLHNRRAADGLLHPSGDLRGSLRHSMLRAAGAPTIESDVVGDTRLRIGTMIHTDFEDALRGQPVMLEVKLDPWMPEGWSGTADWIAWHPDKRAFVLGDLKSIKPEGMSWINRDGAKEDHVWQISAYFWALVRMGIPMVNGFVIYYLPTGQLRAKEGFVQPSAQEGTPLPQEQVEGEMGRRWELTTAYLDSLSSNWPSRDHAYDPGWITPELAPVQDRVQRTFINKMLKTPAIDLKLVPHWSCEFCPFPDELCDCRQQKGEKIGHWVPDRDDWEYVPRTGVPQPDEPLRPSEEQIRTFRRFPTNV